MELVYPHLNGVHGTFAIGPSHVLFAGMGGEIVDEPESTLLAPRASDCAIPPGRSSTASRRLAS